VVFARCRGIRAPKINDRRGAGRNRRPIDKNHVIIESSNESAAPEEALRILARLISRRIKRERELDKMGKSRQAGRNNLDSSGVYTMEETQ